MKGWIFLRFNIWTFNHIVFGFLKFVDEVVKIGGVEVKENNLENIAVVELGSTLEIEIQAEGVPGVAFQWFKIPPGKYVLNFSSNSKVSKTNLTTSWI